MSSPDPGSAGSQLGALFPDKIPVSPKAKKVAKLADIDPLLLAISDSVDFRLLFSTPKDSVDHLEELFSGHGWPLYRIGKFEIAKNEPDVFFQIGNDRLLAEGFEWDQSGILTVDKMINEFKTE